jgi:predicted metal-binding protein
MYAEFQWRTTVQSLLMLLEMLLLLAVTQCSFVIQACGFVYICTSVSFSRLTVLWMKQYITTYLIVYSVSCCIKWHSGCVMVYHCQVKFTYLFLTFCGSGLNQVYLICYMII